MSQVRHLYIHAHLCFIALVQDIKHLLGIVRYFDGIKVDLLLSKLLDLRLYYTALGITLRVIITIVMILFSVARSVGNENSILALRLPLLFQRILKGSCHILRHVSATCGSKL
jgi:hypothetical protein